jgi:hypothetical protein
MIDKQAVLLINHDLILKWGARYRLVWADDEREIRVNANGIWDEWPKYSYLKERFVLEKYFGEGLFKVPDEIRNWNGWEIIWAFRPLENPNLAVCMFIADALENGVKQSLTDHYDADKKQFDKEVEEAYDILENESPYIATMLQNKEAIVVPEIKKDA